LAIFVLVGCGTTELQTRAKLTRTITLDKSEKDNKNMYLQVSNTSGGGENLNLLNDLKTKLESKGYRIVENSKEASYGLFVNVLFANNLKEANAIKGATQAGALFGTGAVGAGQSGSNSLLIGAVAALSGGIIGSAMEDDVFRAVIDVEIRDYRGKEIQTARTTVDAGETLTNTDRSGIANTLAGSLGNKDGVTDMESGISESTTEFDTTSYNKYLTRAFVEAIRMDLKLDEALPILSSKASARISNLF
jgi:outer membrane lipoprotein SlyB